MNLRCDFRQNPLGIDDVSPRLTWILQGEGRSRRQIAYQIQVASTQAQLDKDVIDLWDSGKIFTDESANIRYAGASLGSGVMCFWKVRIWDESDQVSEWSKVNHWSVGLLQETDWVAQWIGFDEAWNDRGIEVKPWANQIEKAKQYKPLPSPHLRKEFEVVHEVKSAKVYVTALGVFELYINGQRVGDDYFTPGWTDYGKRVDYNTYEVSALLKKGKNVIAAILADGWYAGNMADRGQYWYGEKLRLKAQMIMEDEAGNRDTIRTDDTWKASYGPIREADLQGGETYDARLEMNGWNQVDYDDKSWSGVEISDSFSVKLGGYPGVPIRKTEEIKPKHIFEISSGKYIVDMGQNFAGWAKIQVNGNPGDSIVMRFAEKLNSDSTLHTRNLRSARCTDTYILKGGGPETWEPRFTYHGYQFIEVSGFPEKLTSENITGIVVHSDLPRTGWFECSDALINRIYSNQLWSQRSNYFDVPTDCPQRDERMGWTGDAQIFMKTAAYNMDVSAFYNKWLVDVVDGQRNGMFPSTAPRVYNRIAAGWGDAGVICPWTFFQAYNDSSILREYYPSMKLWMDYLESKSVNHLSGIGSYGDWQNVKSETPIELITTAYYKHVSDLMAKIATVLDYKPDAQHYNSLSMKIKDAFIQKFVDVATDNTQTADLLALSFDLLPDTLIDSYRARLRNDIWNHDTTLTTGIHGTKFLMPVLGEYDLGLAYQLLNNTKFPSWGHHIENGATTIWERWDSYSDTSGFHKDSTNSLNHYAYGSVGEWFYSTIAGIESDGSGYKHIIIRPQPGGGLTWANAAYNSIRGPIKSSWRIDEGKYHLNISIPANTDATVYIPTSNANSVVESGRLIIDSPDISVISEESGRIVLKVGSGDYSFQSDL
ncbi:MAG: glycoside hydrolase family 78 protein [Flavobacteriales bacterium]